MSSAHEEVRPVAESRPRRGGGADDGPMRKGTKGKAKKAATKPKKAAAKAKPAKSAEPAAGEEAPGRERSPIAEHLGPRLREEFDAVSRSEAKILRALRKDDVAEEFVRDPAAALRRMKVVVPPIMAARLKEPSQLGGLLAPRSYQLPNGQVVTANVRVHLTAGTPGTGGVRDEQQPGASGDQEG